MDLCSYLSSSEIGYSNSWNSTVPAYCSHQYSWSLLVCEIPIGAQWDSTSFSKVSSADFCYCELEHHKMLNPLLFEVPLSREQSKPTLMLRWSLILLYVAAMVLSDSNGNIVQAATKRLSSTDAAIGDAWGSFSYSISSFSWGVLSHPWRGCHQHPSCHSKAGGESLCLCLAKFEYQICFACKTSTCELCATELQKKFLAIKLIKERRNYRRKYRKKKKKRTRFQFPNYSRDPSKSSLQKKKKTNTIYIVPLHGS